MHTELGTMIS